MKSIITCDLEGIIETGEAFGSPNNIRISYAWS